MTDSTLHCPLCQETGLIEDKDTIQCGNCFTWFNKKNKNWYVRHGARLNTHGTRLVKGGEKLAEPITDASNPSDK